MGKFIVKIAPPVGDPEYLIWSTVVDAPITYGMTLKQLEEYVQLEHGREGLRELPARLDRVEQTGCSGIGYTLDGLISRNRAGPGESELTLGEIWQEYCVEPTFSVELEEPE